MERYLKLPGLQLPKLGLGTYGLSGKEGQKAVEEALALGYRHIDTAEMYGNEREIGAALKAARVPRAELIVTTKVWHENLGPGAIQRACEGSLTKLGLDHVDLYLVHWPSPTMKLDQVMGAMASLRDQGLIKTFGVSNFTTKLLQQVMDLGAPIICNQVEYHVNLDQGAVLNFLRPRELGLIAYSPLGQGDLARQPALAAIAKKHGATPSQVALSWLIGQDGVAAIPKSASRERQKQNLGALNLTLDADDLAAIARLSKNQRSVNPAFAPKWD